MSRRTTGSEDQDFTARVLGMTSAKALLEAIRDLLQGDSEWVQIWIADNFEPDDIFNNATLSSWAEQNEYVKTQE